MLKTKLPNVGTTIFSVMSEMANEYNALNLSQGFPDFEVSSTLIDLVNKYMRAGNNQYAPMPGVMKLREIIAQKTEEMYGYKYDPENEITITAGATQALFAIITAVVQEGDEVIIVEPAYDSYVPAIRLNGGTPVFIQLKAPDYSLDWNEVNRAVTNRTKMMIINTPHNPTGSILNADDMEKLQKLVSATKMMILSDEVYEHIIFDDFPHQSVARYPSLAERSIIVSSFGKTFHTTGWKVGYCLAPEAMMREIRKIHQFMVYCVNTPIQNAIADFLRNKNEYLTLNTFYQEKRDYFIKMLSGTKFKIIPSKGTYFQTIDYTDLHEDNDKDMAVLLTQKYRIATIPMSVFYHDKVKSSVLRLCFAKSKETLEKAAEKLIKASNEILTQK